MKAQHNNYKYKNFSKVSLEEDSSPEHIFLPVYEANSVSRCLKAYIDEEVKEPKYYRNLVHAIGTLGDGDMLHLSIDSYGGSLDGCMSIITAMRNASMQGVHVHASIDGTAASAGSLLALAADSIEVGPYATMMVHQSSFGSAGPQSTVMSHVLFVDQKVKAIAQEIYQDFLTDKELDEIFTGKELWFNSEEIADRLQRRAEIQEKRYKKEQQELQKALRNQGNSSRSSRSSKVSKNKTQSQEEELSLE